MFLVDPDTRRLIAGSGRAVQQAGDDIEQELFLQQVETQTEPYHDLGELLTDLRGTRRAAAHAARDVGAVVAAMPTPVLEDRDGVVTGKRRYERMVTRFGQVGRRALACGMHVHVTVSDDDEAAAVVDRLAPWLPLVLAMSTNSPFNLGVDTGYASWRAEVWEAWPTAGPVEPFGDAVGYRRAVSDLIDSGAALDEGMIYFDARIARSFPTVEIRVADVCTDPRDAVVVAAVLRALVDTCAEQWRRGAAASPWRVDLLRAARWRARRDGLGGSLLDPLDGRLTPAGDALDTLRRTIAPALDSHGDLALVDDGIVRLLRDGTGADRQRRVAGERLDLVAVVDDVVDRTLERL